MIQILVEKKWRQLSRFCNSGSNFMGSTFCPDVEPRWTLSILRGKLLLTGVGILIKMPIFNFSRKAFNIEPRSTGYLRITKKNYKSTQSGQWGWHLPTSYQSGWQNNRDSHLALSLIMHTNKLKSAITVVVEDKRQGWVGHHGKKNGGRQDPSLWEKFDHGRNTDFFLMILNVRI